MEKFRSFTPLKLNKMLFGVRCLTSDSQESSQRFLRLSIAIIIALAFVV